MDAAPTSSLAGLTPAAGQPALSAALSVVPTPEPVAPVQSLSDSRWFIHRELSWLAFNERVLEEACDPAVPALERLKFLAIASSNLDEFFMIRVAGLKSQLSGHVEESGPDALSPGEQLQAISVRAHEMVARQYRALLADVLPNLERAGFRLLGPQQLSPASDAFVDEYFWREVFPVLTPIALDPGHPFPHLRNKSLNLAVRFGPASPGARLRYGVVPVPSVLPRLVEIPDHGRCFVLLEDVISRQVARLFPGMPIDGCWPFRVTRNWDLSIDEEEAEDLLVTIEREVRRRDRGSAVRLQINAGADEPTARFLARSLKLGDADVYHQTRPLAISEVLTARMSRPELKHLQHETFTPAVPASLAGAGSDLFDAIRATDVLLHHPY